MLDFILSCPHLCKQLNFDTVNEYFLMMGFLNFHFIIQREEGSVREMEGKNSPAASSLLWAISVLLTFEEEL